MLFSQIFFYQSILSVIFPSIITDKSTVYGSFSKGEVFPVDFQ